MNNFFDNRVKKGNDDLIDLQAFEEVLKGKEVQIIIQGLPSISSTAYMKNLDSEG